MVRIVAGFALLITPWRLPKSREGLRQQPWWRRTTGSMLVLNKCGSMQGLIFRRGIEGSLTAEGAPERPVTYREGAFAASVGPGRSAACEAATGSEAGGRESRRGIACHRL